MLTRLFSLIFSPPFYAIGLALACSGPPTLAADAGRSSRLQELLSGEALYRAQQKDYLSAITRLQLAHEEGLLPQASADTAILLTRLKLGYGLRGEADAAFRMLLDENIAAEVRNRAWYELAKAFFHQSQPQAAKRVLDNIRGRLPDDIQGDHQLLRAHVLMALQQYLDAAQVLERWRGPEPLSGYAAYNRGIALLQAGRHEDAIMSLQRAADLPAATEELLSLKDKARVTLGYTLLRQGDLQQARSQLEQVRLHGPSSNQALLAMGWIAQQQGRAKEALAPWLTLRGRALADPAVQESLLAVPSLHRQLRAPDVAAQHYEIAVDAFSRELNSVNHAMASLQGGMDLTDLQPVESASDTRKSPHMGPLLASRIFQQTARGRIDLRALMENLEQGLQSLDQLAMLTTPPTGTEPPVAAGPGTGEGQPRRPEADQHKKRPRVPQGSASLPQVDLSPEREFKGLPPGYRGVFPESEVLGFPESEVLGFPESKAFNLPKGGGFSMPETGRGRSYPGGEAVVIDRRWSPNVWRRQAIPSAPQVATVEIKQDHTLAELVTALSATRQRLRRLVNRFKLGARPGGELQDHIAALRQRILQLRDRTVAAIDLYEQYAKALALAELERSQRQLESNLKQARLELAKSYDSAGDK